MINWLHNLSDRVNKTVEMVSILFFVVLVVVIAAQVVSRYVFNSSLSWSEELGRIIFLWIIFLGTSIGFKRGAHVGLHFITEMASPKLKKMISVISLICCSIFFLFMLVEGIIVSIKMVAQQTAALEISMSWQLSAIPVGALLMLIHVPSLFGQSEKVGVSHDLDIVV